MKPIGGWLGTAAGPGMVGRDAGPAAGDGCGASDPHRLRRRLFFSRFSVDSAQGKFSKNDYMTDDPFMILIQSVLHTDDKIQ